MNSITATASHIFTGPVYDPGSVEVIATLAGLKTVEGRSCRVNLSFEDVKAIVVKSCNKDRADEITKLIGEIKFR